MESRSSLHSDRRREEATNIKQCDGLCSTTYDIHVVSPPHSIHAAVIPAAGPTATWVYHFLPPSAFCLVPYLPFSHCLPTYLGTFSSPHVLSVLPPYLYIPFYYHIPPLLALSLLHFTIPYTPQRTALHCAHHLRCLPLPPAYNTARHRLPPVTVTANTLRCRAQNAPVTAAVDGWDTFATRDCDAPNALL